MNSWVRVTSFQLIVIAIISIAVGVIYFVAGSRLILAATLQEACVGGDQNACMQIAYGGSSSATAPVKFVMSDAANKMCTPWIPVCGCNQVLVKTTFGSKCIGSKNTYNCQPGVCQDTIAGFTILGVCDAEYKCRGVVAPGLNGSGNVIDSALSQLGQAVGQMLQQLMQGSPGGGSGGSTSQYPTTCPNGSYTTSDISVYQSDPNCAQYVASSSSAIDTSIPGSGADALLNALNGTSNTSGSGITITNNNDNTNTNTNTDANTLTGTASTSTGVTIAGAGFPVSLNPLSSSASGDIELNPFGATILAGQTDVKSNTTVAGFYGSDTLGAQQPQSLAANLCQNRPWASSFLSIVIPSSFFDSLCTWRGYQVGNPQPASQPVLEQTPVQHQAPTPTSTPVTTSTVPPQVDIWAVPASVPLATRTTVYWNTQGVTNCTITSSDGNFNQNSLSGGAATVPLTAATTFTITCDAPDGTQVTGSTIVTLAI